MSDEDIYDEISANEKTAGFDATKKMFEAPKIKPKPEILKPKPSSFIARQANGSAKPAIPPKSGPMKSPRSPGGIQLPVSADAVSVTRQHLRNIPEKRQSAQRTSRITIPDAFSNKSSANTDACEHPLPFQVVLKKVPIKPKVKVTQAKTESDSLDTKPKVNQPQEHSPTSDPTSNKNISSPYATPHKVTPHNTPVTKTNSLPTSFAQETVNNSCEISPQPHPEVTKETDQKENQDQNKEGPTHNKDQEASDSDIVTSCDGKTYRQLELPPVTGPPPDKPLKPDDIVFIPSDGDDLYDEVESMRTTNIAMAASAVARPVSAISEWKEDEELGKPRESTISEGDDLYDTVAGPENDGDEDDIEVYETFDELEPGLPNVPVPPIPTSNKTVEETVDKGNSSHTVHPPLPKHPDEVYDDVQSQTQM